MYDDEKHPFIRTSSFVAQKHPSISPLFFSLFSRSVFLSLSRSLKPSNCEDFEAQEFPHVLQVSAQIASRLAIRSFALNSCFGIFRCFFCCYCDSDFGRGWRCAIKIRTKILCSSLNYWQTDIQTDRQTYIHQVAQQIAGAFHSGGDYQVVNCSKGCMYASLL